MSFLYELETSLKQESLIDEIFQSLLSSVELQMVYVSGCFTTKLKIDRKLIAGNTGEGRMSVEYGSTIGGERNSLTLLRA